LNLGEAGGEMPGKGEKFFLDWKVKK